MKNRNKINSFSRFLRAPQRGALRASRSLLLRKPCPLALITRSRINLFYFGFFLVVFFLLFVPAVQAQVIGNWEFLQGIVPCGRCAQFGLGQDGRVVCLVPSTGATSAQAAPCTVCHFYKLLQNIINFLLYVSASLVTLMAIYIAFLFMFSGGSPAKISDAKGKLWLLVWGIFWVLGSWLVLNTIITFFANPGVFPTPWYQISCEISQSSGGGNTGGENTGGGGNVDGGKIDFSDHIFEDVRADIDIPSGEVKITNETTGKTKVFDLTTEGAGIALVRDSYPNVFIIGGDLPLSDAVKLKESLDRVYTALPSDYKNIKDSYILVSTNKDMHNQMVIAAGDDPKKYEGGRSFISNNNTSVVGTLTSSGIYTLEETLVHELAHQRAHEQSGSYSGDFEWQELYVDSIEKGAFISDYAKTNFDEDLAETVTATTLAGMVDFQGNYKAYTGDESKDRILAKKYEYLKRKGYINNIPQK